jgi:diacylglycerol kinase (ATP)
MRTIAILNPVAAGGRHKARHASVVACLREHLGTVDVAVTEAPGHATSLTREALLRGVDRVVAVGGDGTANEVLNGFLATDGTPHRRDAVLGLVPMGTGMDFRRSVAIPVHPEDAIARIAEMRIREVDVGRVESADGSARHFLNVASIGVSAGVIERVESAQWFKRVANPAAFAVAAVRAVLAHEHVRARVLVDGDEVCDAEVGLCAVANGGWFGAGMHIAPDASVDDGLLEVIVASDLTRAQMLAALRHLYAGTHATLPFVTVRRARRVEVRPRVPAASHRFELDGQLGLAAPATLTVVPRVLRLLT